VWACDDVGSYPTIIGWPRDPSLLTNAELTFRSVQHAMHLINIAFDRLGDGAGRGRGAMFSSEFAGEIMGEVLDAHQARDERDIR
jgi:hypothetical protein